MRSFILALYLFCSFSCFAKTGDIQSMLAKCESSIDSIGKHYCLVKVQGVGDVLEINGSLEPHGTVPVICFNADQPTIGAEIQAFENWAHLHPEKWTLPDTLGVVFALEEKWPCDKSRE